MALPTQTILDSAGATRTVSTLASGRQAAVDSAAMVLSTEDKAALDLIAAAPSYGPDAIGAAPTKPPVLSSGIDFTGKNQVATVAQLHSANLTRPPSTAFSAFSSGAAQLGTPTGLLNTQTETGGDNTSHVGISTGAQQIAVPINTTLVGAVIANATAATLAGAKFTLRGVPAWVRIGSTLVIDAGTASEERVSVSAINYGTNVVTIIGAVTPYGFQFAHAGGATVATAAFYTALSSAAPDGVMSGGMGASGTFFWNQSYNAGLGGWEAERSFLGELNGATGSGGNVAAEFEDTAGGPPLASGVVSGMRLAAAQSVQGKGRGVQTITATGAGNTTLVFASAAATNMISTGSAIQLLTAGAVVETVFVANVGTWVPGSSATVPLASPVVNAGSTQASWDMFAANGPGLNGFNVNGIGIEEEALYDPVTGLFYLERAATQDNMPPQNIVAEAGTVLNAAGNFERERAAYADNLSIIGIPAEAEMLWNGSGFDRARSAVSDAMASTGVAAENSLLWNGTSFDRERGLNGAAFVLPQATVFFNDTTTVLAASATFTGTARDVGVAAGAQTQQTYFNGSFFADQAGTASIEVSNDNTTFRTMATAALAASTPLILTVPIMTRYHRVKLVNGATLQGLSMVNSSYTGS
jgi:hypothetical protein